MFVDQCRAALAAAPLHALDGLAKKAIAAWSEGQLDDQTLEEITAGIHARRTAFRASNLAAGDVQRPPRLFGPRIRQRAPRSSERLERRRMLGTSSAFPPALRSKFTLGEVAVLTVIIGDVRSRGFCDASIAEIGARAGACCTLVRSAIRMAETLGLVVVTLRPRKGAKNLPNIIRVISAELKAWIARSGGHRVQKSEPIREKKSKQAHTKPSLACNRSPEKRWKRSAKVDRCLFDSEQPIQ